MPHKDLKEVLDEREGEIKRAKQVVELTDSLYGALDKVLRKRIERNDKTEQETLSEEEVRTINAMRRGRR